MDELIDSLDTLKFEKYIPYNLNKTGFIYNTDLFDNVESLNNSENIKQAFKKLYGGCLNECLNIKGRKLNEEEKKIINGSLQIEKNDAYALGSCLSLVDQIQDNSIDNGIVFLNSNNIEHSLVNLSMQKHGLKRILLVDWDINHNLKSQTNFYGSSKVLKFSIHRFDDGNFPMTTFQSNFDHIGDQDGIGYNVNVPLNECGCGDSDFIAILYNLLLPIAYEFNPELIILPTSFDMVIGSWGQQKISPPAFGHFIHSLSCLANGKLLLLINGNNDSKLYTDCVNNCIRSLLGYPSHTINPLSEPSPKIVESILSCITVLRPYWVCLQSLNDHSSITLEDFLQIEKNKLQNLNAKETLEAPQLTPMRLSPRRLNSKNGDQEIVEMMANIELNKPPCRTCICSDEAMMAHENLMMDHPEKPERIKRILESLKEKRLYERCGNLEARLALDEELELTHDLNYVNSLKVLKSKTREELIALSKNPDSVYFHFDTFECAKLAAGSVLSIVDAVCNNKFTNGVAISRPPGHHANSNACSGFCFFNSIAVAAKYAQTKYPFIKKVLILDFDVHHGNGTQEIFKDDDSVLFISLHRYDEGYFYPANALSNFNYIGEGNGKGYSINIPWNQVSGDAEYLAAFLRIVMPVSYEFSPDLVLVSAGFDAALGDPLGGYKVTPIGYAQMTKMLSSLANGRVIMALEGGYNLNSISESMSSCVSALLGDPIKSIPPIHAKPRAYESIRNVRSSLKSYWNCFKFDGKLPSCQFLKPMKQKNTNKNHEVLQIPNDHYHFRSTRSRNINIRTEAKTSRNSSPSKSNKSPPTTQHVSIETQNTNESLNMNLKKSDEISLTFCPHLHEMKKTLNFDLLKKHVNCSKPNDSQEDWICLNCLACCTCCKGMKKSMQEHFEETDHSMALTYTDLSIWCNSCNTYVNNDLQDVIQFTPRNIKDIKIEQ